MTGDVTVRTVDRADTSPQFLEEANAVLQSAFGRWPHFPLPVAAADHLGWKMNGPLPGQPAALVAELDGRIAGLRTVLARRVLVHGEPKLFLHFVDAAVRPDLQGLGISNVVRTLMTDEANPTNDLCIDDGDNPRLRRGRERLGGTRPFGNPIREFFLPLGPPTFRGARPLIRTTLERLLSTSTRLAARRSRVPAATDLTIRTIDAFDERFTDFCADALAPFDFALERTVDFLNWRYTDPRAGTFTIRVAERQNRLLGYIVSTQQGPRTSIVDLLVTPDHRDRLAVCTALLQDAIHTAEQTRSTTLTCWLAQHHPYRPVLRAAGFIAFRGLTSLSYRAGAMSWESLAFLDHPDTPIHITHGDTDTV